MRPALLVLLLLCGALARAHGGEELRALELCMEHFSGQAEVHACFTGYLDAVAGHDRHAWCVAVACDMNGRCESLVEFETYARCRLEIKN
ncbi:MAG: hypothetical protein F4147_12465 [Gammaproteobacteria bacterium]|nr:hypothetical protein [Gammaproteobacteria bacterium]MYH70837.1 hypothetical protein [Gammaproteobacteria bacterium]